MSECQSIVCCPKDPFSYSVDGPQVFYNTRQCATANCPDGQTGSPQTRCIDAGVYSDDNQAGADAKAYNAAFDAATAALSCSGGGACSNMIPPMTSFNTPLGTVIVPSNMSAPVGNEGWRAFNTFGEYKPNPFVGGLDNGKYCGAAGYLFASAIKASSFNFQFGAMDNGKTFAFTVIAYANMPAGWPAFWTDVSVFPGGGTVLANVSGVSDGTVQTTPSFNSTSAFKLFVFFSFIGNAPPWQPVAVKSQQICGTT